VKVLCLVALGLGTALPLCGQEPLPRTVFGLVLDSLSGRPLARAEVYFTTQVGQSRTGPDGRFWLEGGTARDSVLVVRRIGYVARTVVVTPAARLRAIDVGSVYLRPVATELDAIAVEAEEVRRYPVLEGFYQRRQVFSGLGHFLTREFVARTGAPRTSDVLRRSHKVEIECSKYLGGPCAATSRRARETRYVMRPRDSTGVGAENDAIFFEAGRCRMQVWVDGVRNPFDIDAIPVDWIVGIEIYSGPGATPPVFGTGPCGVVAIWTVVARK
jgi:carboxypeptidase family protein